MVAAEPEREIVRRVLPLAVPAFVVAVVGGALLGGRDAAISAGLAIVVVVANFAFYGLSLAYAARISLTLLYAVGLGGFVVRMALLVILLLLLEPFAWFSAVAFAVALFLSTVALLSVEIKMVSGRMQAELWSFPPAQEGSRR